MVLNRFPIQISICKKEYRYQMLAAMIVQLITLSHGIGLGWLSPALTLLKSTESPLDFEVSVEDVSWIGSFYGIGSFVGNIIFGLLLNRIGRKWCLQVIAMPHITHWILIYFAENVNYLYVARFMSGVTGGGNYLLLPIYISEISDPSIRGALSAMSMMFMCSGILLGFILGTHLSYHEMPCIVVVIPLLFFAATLLLKETPQFHLRKGNVQKAEISYNFYKNINYDAISVNEQQVKRSEFNEFKADAMKGTAGVGITMADFVNKTALHSFLTAIVIIMLNQLCGLFAFISYMSQIFEASGSQLDPNMCTIITGIVQIGGSMLATVVVDRIGRKILMLISTSTMAAFMIAFASYAQFASEQVKEQNDWIPLFFVVSVMFTASLGISTLIFVLVVEVLPAKIRSIATSICMTFLSVMVFVSLKVFPIMLHDMGIPFTFYCSAGVCVVGFVYLAIFLKDTSNKSIDSD